MDPEKYSRALKAIKFSSDGASHDTLQTLLRRLATEPEHQRPGSDLRMVAADALQDHGMDTHAEQLRSNLPLAGYAHNYGQNLYIEHNGTHYQLGTPQPVINALENARRNGTRIRLHYGDDNHRDTLNDFEATGTVGRSMGQIRMPLIINNRRSFGGGSISTARLKRISTTVGGRTLYQHPQYHVGKITVGPSGSKSHPVGVFHDGQLHAGFRTPLAAQRWIKRMGLTVSSDDNV